MKIQNTVPPSPRGLASDLEMGPTAPKSKLVLLKKASSIVLTSSVVIIHGPPKVGKTWLAATASVHWPREIPAKKKTVLSDLVHIQIDAGATDGFPSNNIELDVLDMRSAIEATGRPVNAASETLKVLQDYLRSNKQVTTVIVDTISVYDKFLTEWWGRNAPTTKDGLVDKFAMYAAIADSHKRFHLGLTTMGKQIIYCCHSKALIEPSGKDAQVRDAKLKREAASAVAASIVPDITGAALNLYRADASLQLVVGVRRGAGKKADRTRVVYPFGHDEFEGGSRFESALDFEEEPNLKAILDKCRQAAKPAG